MKCFRPGILSKMLTHRRAAVWAACAATLLAGCTAAKYRKSADKEVYKALGQKQIDVFGKTNEFNIATRYSQRDPKEIKAQEIIQERIGSEKRVLSLSEALKTAIENSRAYQTRKEQLYLTALTLTKDRYDFGPKFFGSSKASVNRDTTGKNYRDWNNQVGMDQFFKSGASLSVTLLNDVLRYYTGNSQSTASTLTSVNFLQPLLRGAGADIAAERLTQSERNVIYEIRSFSRFQNTFALDIISTYYRLLQQKDTVRNEYNNYRNLTQARERAEALAVDRLPAFQADQAQQDELSAKSRYILAVESYRASLDSFKITLGIPVETDLALDDGSLDELAKVGLLSVNLTELQGYGIAVDHRLDLLNEIDAFEDAKRKIRVAANRLKADVNIFANASLQSRGPTDYTHFNISDYAGGAGLQVNLPFDRLVERNAYRASLITFESELRSLSLALDNVQNSVRLGVRALVQNQQNFVIQQNAVELADRRVESATLLLQAGRAQIRDMLDAQSSQLAARNALSKALVDYHIARITLLINLGILDTGEDRFWLRQPEIPGTKGDNSPAAQAQAAPTEVIPPEQLFGK